MTAASTQSTSSARPLQPTKRLPALTPHAPTHTHTHTHTPVKRARFSLDPMTPQPSSDIDIGNSFDHTTSSSFKLPSIPPRVMKAPMTPSTSTVAYSSSPRRAMPSSSPSKASHFHPYSKSKSIETSEVEHDLVVRRGTTLIFGRHRHTSNSKQSTSSTLSSSVPRHLAHLLASPENTAETYHLSRHASHASRVHAVIELLPLDTSEQVLRIVVVGQNGVRVRVPGRKKTLRLLQGQRFDTPLTDQGVEIDFFGSRVIARTELPVPAQVEEEQDQRERLFSASPATPVRHLDSSLPPSSPPLSAVDFDDAMDEDEASADGHEEAQELFKLPSQRIDSRASSPLSPASDSAELPAEHIEPPSAPSLAPVAAPEEQAETDSKAVKAEQIEQAAPLPTTPSVAPHKPASRAASPVVVPSKPLPADVDLPAIIASTVVFSGSSKLSLPDLVKHMLESQPSLKAHGEEAQWSTWVHDALETNEMFGKVARNGKDSSGHPLLPHYFYNPASDPDASRAKELGGLVRPLRAAQRAGGKAIDWRPVGRGRRTHG